MTPCKEFSRVATVVLTLNSNEVKDEKTDHEQ